MLQTVFLTKESPMSVILRFPSKSEILACLNQHSCTKSGQVSEKINKEVAEMLAYKILKDTYLPCYITFLLVDGGVEPDEGIALSLVPKIELALRNLGLGKPIIPVKAT